MHTSRENSPFRAINVNPKQKEKNTRNNFSFHFSFPNLFLSCYASKVPSLKTPIPFDISTISARRAIKSRESREIYRRNEKRCYTASIVHSRNLVKIWRSIDQRRRRRRGERGYAREHFCRDGNLFIWSATAERDTNPGGAGSRDLSRFASSFRFCETVDGLLPPSPPPPPPWSVTRENVFSRALARFLDYRYLKRHIAWPPL